jgi:putative SOS response-associated peptidase YedK
MPRPKSARCRGEHELFGSLTTEAKPIVAPIHPEAMPVVLTSAAEVDVGLKRTRSGADASAAIA